MNDDDLKIPDFLRRSTTSTVNEKPADHIDKKLTLPSVELLATLGKPKGMSLEEWAEVKARRADEKKEQHKVYMSRSKQRKQDQLARAEAKRATQEAIANGARWDAINNRWITQETEMPKWIITPYIATAETDGLPSPNKRAISSIKEGTDRKELANKIVAVALRSGKRTTKIEITDSKGLNLLETWTVDGQNVTAENGDSFPLVAKQEEKEVVAKSESKKSTTRKKLNGGPGVIETIVKIISRDRGASIVECVDELKKVFPDRKVSSMTFTVKKQAYLNAKRRERDEKRGVVYYGTK